MDNLCRTCATTIDVDKSPISVFKKTEAGETIAGLLAKYCSIEIMENDMLPKDICDVCLDLLLASENFRRTCEQSEQKLHKMLEKPETTVVYFESSEVNDTKLIEEIFPPEGETNQSIPAEQVDDEEYTASCYSVVETMSFRCCLCNGISYSQKDHREHIELAHQVVFPDETNEFNCDFTCFICQQGFANSEELEAHQGKSFQELYQCIQCEEIYESIDDVTQHFYQSHTEKKEENEKSPLYTDERKEKTPTRRVKSGAGVTERYCCVTHCHEVFPSEDELISHAQEAHELKLKHNRERNDPDKPYVCQICFRSFGSTKNLKAHQFIRANHVQGKHFFCGHCPFRAVSRNLLTIHERSKHSGERPYECDQCDKRFFSELHLKSHLVCHSSERPFLCTVCKKSFIRKRNLDEHIRSCHSDEKPFKCDCCPARFKVPQHLRIHARIHSGEKPYKCSYCDNSYYHISDRKRHEMTHTGEKPYRCESCGATFTRKRTLKIHERTHSGERPYFCAICTKGFCQKATLKKHMERHISTESDIIVTADILEHPDELCVVEES